MEASPTLSLGTLDPKLLAQWERSSQGVLVESDEQIVFLNDAYARTLGYERADKLLGNPVASVIGPSDQQRMLEYGRRRANGEFAPTSYEFYGKRKDGALVPLRADITTIRDRNRVFIATTIRMLTDAGMSTEFAELYDKHASLLFAVLMRILGNEADAQEALQETFLQAWRERRRFNEVRGSRAAWLVMIARSRGIDRLRRRARELRLLNNPEMVPRKVEPERATFATDQRRAVHALSSLPAEQRETIELAYFEGLTQSEIASRLRLPPAR